MVVEEKAEAWNDVDYTDKGFRSPKWLSVPEPPHPALGAQ